MAARIIHSVDGKIFGMPTMPFVIAFNGTVGETNSIKDLISVLIPEYLDSEDDIDDWNLRVQFARKQCMKLLAQNINAVVYDERKGIINNNYAAGADNSDYEEDHGEDYMKIRIDSESEFLRSLSKVNIIKVLERDDIECLNYSGDKKCLECINSKKICSVYNMELLNDDKNKCGSFSKGNMDEYIGGRYIEFE